MALILSSHEQVYMFRKECQTTHVTWRLLWTERQGQSTLEYALVLGAFMVLILALGALWRLGAKGELQRLAESASSHIVDSLFGVFDIVMF